MEDKIIYCDNINILKKELEEKGYKDELGNFTHGNLNTPIFKNGLKTITLIRENKLECDEFDSLIDLGTYEEIFADDGLLSVYKSVYPYDIPIVYKDADGEDQSFMRPQKIGEFA